MVRVWMVLGAVLAAVTGVVGASGAGAGAATRSEARAHLAGPLDLRMNHIQVKGSHNSYHIEPPPETIDAYMGFDDTAYTLAYTHDPLPVQLEEQGVRQIELDVFNDPDGAYPPDGTPGFKVMHIEQIDMGSTCPLLVTCLEQVEAWSDDNPRHVPFTILLELKDADDLPVPPAPGPMTADVLHDLDDVIRTVFDEDDLVTPDFLRGVGRPGGADGQGTVYDNPRDAVLGFGWPRLEDVRGRVMFVLDNRRTEYVDGDPSLAGRVAFPPSVAGAEDAAFLKMNNSVGDPILPAVEAGYMVRTRADFPVETGLSGDATNREAALASGAHFISGDYLTPTDYARYDAVFADRYGQPFDPDRPPYETIVPGGTPARCNPVTAPEGCTSHDIEDLESDCHPGGPALFSDVESDHRFCLDVEWAADEGVTGGFPDGTFRPRTTVSRQAMATFLYRFSGAPAGDDPPCAADAFDDVPADHAFCGEIAWAVAEGITEGFADGTFRPGQAVTRQAMAAFLYRVAGSPAGEDPVCSDQAFTDVPTDHLFCGEIDWLDEQGIASGFEDGSFGPRRPVSRQAMVAFLHRMDDVIDH